MKMFEDFMQSDYEMDQIINKIMNRIKYWFNDGSMSMDSVLIDQSKTSNPNSAKRSVIANFANSEFYYQMIIKFNIEDLEKCDLIIKKYDPSNIDDIGGGQPIWTIKMDNDKKVKINDIKEDFVVQKISEKDDDTKENPDENKIEIPKEKSNNTQKSQTPQQNQNLNPTF